MKRDRLIKVGIGVVLLGALGWVSFDRLYASPVGSLETALSKIRTQTQAFKQGTPSGPAIRRARRELESTVLATELDEFEHLLRTRLSGLAVGTGLDEVVVSHSSPDPVVSPVLASRIKQREIKSAFRKEPDFFRVQGKLTGRGSPESISQTIAMVQSQAWVHHIQSIRVTPVGKQRRQMQLDLGFELLFSPSASLPADREHELTPPDQQTLASARSLSTRPLFRAPDPVPVAPVVATSPATPKPITASPDSKWRVSGIVTGPIPEVWFVHSQNAQRRVLRPGDQILNATLVEVQPNYAQIMINDTHYRVALGRTLASRQVVTEEEPSQ